MNFKKLQLLSVFIFLISFSAISQDNQKTSYSFSIVEDRPIYPGCKGSEEDLNKCFKEKIYTHFGKNFNSYVLYGLGLSKGAKEATVTFIIDKTGKVIDVEAKAPHLKLEKEFEKIAYKLPKMTPGKQMGRSVDVKYSIPIKFFVKETDEEIRKKMKRLKNN
jgi:protein TonB